jgi:O-antigen/teichoic acid export membrane protein
MGSVKFIAMGALVQQVLAMLVTVVVTRLLGVDGYGKLVTLVAVAGTLFSVTSQWSLPFALREASVAFSQTGRLGIQFIMPFIFSLCILLAVVWASPMLPESLVSGLHALPFPVIVCATLGYFLFQVAKAAYQTQSRFLAYSVVLCADKFFVLVAIGALALWGVLSVGSALWVQATGILLSGLIGLWWGLRGVVALGTTSFNHRAYFRSAAPIAASLLISNLASLTFLIIRGGASASEAAWLGMGNMMLGLMLQPFNWLAPTLAPRLSNDVLAPDARERVWKYLDEQLYPLLLLSLAMAMVVALVCLQTPILGWVFGLAFQGAAPTIATAAFLAPAEVANMLIIQLVYAKSREATALPAMALKALPFLLGLYLGWDVGWMLWVLNAGSWLMIAVLMWAVRDCWRPAQAIRYAWVAGVALTVQVGSLVWTSGAIVWILVCVGCGCGLLLAPSLARLMQAHRQSVASP